MQHDQVERSLKMAKEANGVGWSQKAVEYLIDAVAAIAHVDLGDVVQECTGLTARWCPRCGTCTCPDRSSDLNTPGCPLHDDNSEHAEGPADEDVCDVPPAAPEPAGDKPEPSTFQVCERCGEQVPTHLLDAGILMCSPCYHKTQKETM